MKEVQLSAELLSSVKTFLSAEEAMRNELSKLKGKRLIWRRDQTAVYGNFVLHFEGREAEVTHACEHDGKVVVFVKTARADKTGWLDTSDTFHRTAHSINEFYEV